MTSAESTPGQPAAMTAARIALARVLGIDGGVVRADTPLSPLGWDSLARICWEEAMSEAGWRCALGATPSTVGELAASCTLAGEQS
jgi:hypothetical protein